MNQKFKATIKLLQKLPGVGPRQAARFVLALLEKDGSELNELGQAIINLKKDIRLCRECFNLSAAPEGRASHPPRRRGRKKRLRSRNRELGT